MRGVRKLSFVAKKLQETIEMHQILLHSVCGAEQKCMFGALTVDTLRVTVVVVALMARAYTSNASVNLM